MAAFVVYENAHAFAFSRIDRHTITNSTETAVNLGSGLLAGFAAALVSQPADTLLSRVNRASGLPGEGTYRRLIKITKELGIRGSYSGIGPRLIMVGSMVAGQFTIYGSIKKVCEYFGITDYWIFKLTRKALGAAGGVEIPTT